MNTNILCLWYFFQLSKPTEIFKGSELYYSFCIPNILRYISIIKSTWSNCIISIMFWVAKNIFLEFIHQNSWIMLYHVYIDQNFSRAIYKLFVFFFLVWSLVLLSKTRSCMKICVSWTIPEEPAKMLVILII